MTIMVVKLKSYSLRKIFGEVRCDFFCLANLYRYFVNDCREVCEAAKRYAEHL